jgi:hypothetical protein
MAMEAFNLDETFRRIPFMRSEWGVRNTHSLRFIDKFLSLAGIECWSCHFFPPLPTEPPRNFRYAAVGSNTSAFQLFQEVGGIYFTLFMHVQLVISGTYFIWQRSFVTFCRVSTAYVEIRGEGTWQDDNCQIKY